MAGEYNREDNALAVTKRFAGLVPYTIEQVFKTVDEIVARAVEEGDPEGAFLAGLTFQKAEELSGKGLARLLYDLKKNWPKFKQDVPFEDVAYQYFGDSLKKENIDRYIRVIEEIYEGSEVPEEFKRPIEERPIRDLIPIATTLASGYPINEVQWEKLADANNNNEVQETLREIKGTPPRSNSLVIRMTRDGTLYAYAGGQAGVYIGNLEVRDAQENDTIKRAVTRIVNAAGILVE